MESGKKGDGISDTEINERKSIIEMDLCFNPTSFALYIIYGYLNSFIFRRTSEALYSKGQKSVSALKGVSEFDYSLYSLSQAAYILMSKYYAKSNESPELIYSTFGFDPISTEWCIRGDELKRWADVADLRHLYNTFLVFVYNINM